MALSNYGKLCIANIEFEKGVAFVVAAHLLDRVAKSEPQEYVALHLLAQGIELLVKGALYARNYGAYKKMGRRLGHRLEVLYCAAEDELGLKPLQPDIEKQLQILSKLFSEHALRYAGAQDIVEMPSSIDVSLVEARVRCAIRLGRREFRKAFSAYKQV